MKKNNQQKKTKMKNQVKVRRQTILLAAIAIIFICGACGSAFVQGKFSKKYGYGTKDAF